MIQTSCMFQRAKNGRPEGEDSQPGDPRFGMYGAEQTKSDGAVSSLGPEGGTTDPRGPTQGL